MVGSSDSRDGRDSRDSNAEVGTTAEFGMIGLGRMGAGMVERLRRAGHRVVGYDQRPGARDVDSLPAFVTALSPPRVVWVMVPSGAPTDATLSELGDLLSPGDVVVDGGNSRFTESVEHASSLHARGVGFLDAGVSGGVWGLENGYGLMVGGSSADVATVQPFFDVLKPPNGGFVHAGPAGSGHFTKMVHNGVEYGLMQAYAEGYELLRASDFDIDVPAVIEAWREGTVIRSWLLDLFARALTSDAELRALRGYAQDSGEGRWTVQTAVDLAVPLPVISSALFARFGSRQQESPAMKVVAALRQQFGGHAVTEVSSDRDVGRGAAEADISVAPPEEIQGTSPTPAPATPSSATPTPDRQRPAGAPTTPTDR